MGCWGWNLGGLGWILGLQDGQDVLHPTLSGTFHPMGRGRHAGTCSEDTGGVLRGVTVPRGDTGWMGLPSVGGWGVHRKGPVPIPGDAERGDAVPVSHAPCVTRGHPPPAPAA